MWIIDCFPRVTGKLRTDAWNPLAVSNAAAVLDISIKYINNLGPSWFYYILKPDFVQQDLAVLQ